jgi:hypothetical protein
VVQVDSLDVGVFLDGGRVDLEGLVVLPDLLGLFFNVHQGIALGGLLLLIRREEKDE